ncbi:MAG: hypothetical protein QOH60_4728 [Mycobacterium sp.]|jgi:hypothetical protein|nr:hypothetical protein [Mycobacterium sp.]
MDTTGGGTLTHVSDRDTHTGVESKPVGQVRPRVLSGFGVGSAVLGLVCVAAIVLTSLIWSSHRDQKAEFDYKARVISTAVNWAGVLINMNKDNIETSVQKLHDETVGTLNSELDSVLAPLMTFVKKVQLKTTGRIDAVAFESVHQDVNRQPGTPPPDTTLGGLASRTDTALIIATLVAETKGGPVPQSSLTLRIGISDVGGKLLVSDLEMLR